MRALIGLVLIAVASVVSATEYREVMKDNLVVMELDTGKVIFELAPRFAPNHVAQFKKLIRDGKYDGKSFYRVIEGFVAQGGLNDDSTSSLKIEAEFPTQLDNFTEVQQNDMFAPVTGFVGGFAVAKDSEKAWLVHCPGVLAMARASEPDTGSSDFYIPIGQAPRYLDRIMTIFGRVVHGMDTVQRILRAEADAPGGVIEDETKRTKILKVSVMSDLPEEKQLAVKVEQTHGEAFVEKLDGRRNRTHEFFFKKPPPVLDVCQIPMSAIIE